MESAAAQVIASPAIAGSIGLLTQLYKQLHPLSSDPLASTLKSLVIETADSGTTNNGPSYRFGWGLMNTKNAAIFSQSRRDERSEKPNQRSHVEQRPIRASFPSLSKRRHK